MSITSATAVPSRQSTASGTGDVAIHRWNAAGPGPLVVEPRSRVDLAAWLSGNRALVGDWLDTRGAILFRGFDVATTSAFEQAASALTGALFGEYGDLPKEHAGESVYHSTPYPAHKHILFHNEASHTDRWPMKQWFYCVVAPREQGETPIVDCRVVYDQLDPAVRDAFARKRLRYVRNFVDGLDVSWQEFFKTADRGEVERYCGAAGIDCEWRPDGTLRTSQLSPAVLRHPRTNEAVFFNQIQLHHVASLEADVRASMLELFTEEQFPRNVTYGDGTPIPDSVVQDVTSLCWANAVALPWQERDILLVDNMLTAHARNPFVGPRKIVVAMGEMIGRHTFSF